MPLNETPPMKSFCVRHWLEEHHAGFKNCADEL